MNYFYERNLVCVVFRTVAPVRRYGSDKEAPDLTVRYLRGFFRASALGG